MKEMNIERMEDERIVKAIEKVVGMVSELEKKINDLEEKENKNRETNKKENDLLKALLTKIETKVNQMGAMVSYSHHITTTEEDVKNWMMEEKDKDATDYQMTKEEIARGFRDYKDRRGH
jgi:hypothetical protein